MTVGDNSVHSEASCYQSGAKLSQSFLQSCLRKDGGQTVKIDAAADFHVGVDPAIAAKGWFLVVGGQATPVMKETYRTFGGAQLFSGSTRTATVDVLQSGDGTTNDVTGVWQFKLELAN